MSQAQQVKFSLPENSFNVIDNSAASTQTTLSGPNNSSPIGFDSPAGNSIVPAGATSQGQNLFANTGTTTLDVNNDSVWADPQVATVVGNPVSAIFPTYKTVSVAVQNSTMGIFVKYKNPA
jgi:hypothetical protein